jgi:threonylcarbamoyladenosine tRNA methylthiotransferase MtaB
MSAKTFKIYELGCKVNQYESQLIREQFERDGFMEGNGLPADVYVINTCTVTDSADSQSRNLLRRALRLNPEAKIIVTGCYVEKNSDDIKKICPGAVILKNSEKPGEGMSGIHNFTGHNRAFVKIQDGCDNHCSYCKVPLVRGRARNRDKAEIVNEVTQLAISGFKEIVLCGICLGAYKNLTGFLSEISGIKALKRIRLSSIEPVYVTEELVDYIASSEKMCKHLHIPLQSGDDRILKTMNRKYTKKGYIDLIDGIRTRLPLVAISTDVLVGFPGETGKEFRNTLDTLKRVSPMRTHVFGFSARKGTAAFSMSGQVDKEEKQERAKVVRDFAQKSALSYAEKFLNTKSAVLVESSRDKKTGMLSGYTDTYIKVLFEGEDSLMNEIADVRIDKILSGCVLGVL